jgi:short-subunit dehydrogenase
MIQAATQTSAGTALITGASSGIGYEFALLFARHGYDLALVARNRAALSSLSARVRDEFGRRVDVFVKDLSLPTAPGELFQEIQTHDIDVDVLVNDAGFAMQGEFTENDVSSLLDMVQVNIVSLTELTRLFLPPMRRRGHGKILNMASIGAFMPGPLMAAYFASKAYVLSLSEALSNELRGTGVTVTAVCPGPTRTRFAQRARLIDTKAFRGRLMEPADVAREGFDALMKGKTVMIPGLKHRLQLFPTPLVPRRVLAYFARQYHETVPAPETDVSAAHAWAGAAESAPSSHAAH